MPRQNRVTPFGEIVAIPERGTFMGNRGILHDETGHIRRPWQVNRWLLCLLEFRGRKRTVMTPNRYTELFFLDDATGLAAGHRPCFECRRDRFTAFVNAWPRDRTSSPPTASMIDDQLHAERVGPNRMKQTFVAGLDELPDGVFVHRKGLPDQPYLIWRDGLLLWSPGGYQQRVPLPQAEDVLVLTPRSTVEAIRAGYIPEVHPSAEVTSSVRPSAPAPYGAVRSGPPS
jgi:hypothetical protein